MGRRSSVAGNENGGRVGEGGCDGMDPLAWIGSAVGFGPPGGATIREPQAWQNLAFSGTEAPQELQKGIVPLMELP
jgi:hypothetical protein